jgi:hypothetical protein
LPERLPGINELLEFSGPLSQVVRAFSQEFQRFNVTLLIEPICQSRQPLLPPR